MCQVTADDGDLFLHQRIKVIFVKKVLFMINLMSCVILKKKLNKIQQTPTKTNQK
jgi:hypothetical protein